MPRTRGRPSDFLPQHCKRAYRLSLLGVKEEDMAEIFEVSVVTFNAWKKKHPEFLKSIKKGRKDADAHVADSLYKKALGYERVEIHKEIVNGIEVKVKKKVYYPPDTTAAIFWLKNRHKDDWRDRQDIDHTSGGRPLKIGVVTYGEPK